MREKILAALIAHAEGNIAKHKVNIENYFNNPVAVGEHPDIVSTIEEELDKIEKYESRISTLRKHFPQPV